MTLSRRYSILPSDFPEAALTPDGGRQLSGKLNVKIASLAFVRKEATLTTDGQLSIGNEKYFTKSIVAVKFRWIEASEVVDVKLNFGDGKKLTLRFTGINARLVTNQGRVKFGIQLASDKQGYDFYKLLGRLIGGESTAPANFDDSLLDASLFSSTIDNHLTGLYPSETSFSSGGGGSPAAFDVWNDPFDDVESPETVREPLSISSEAADDGKEEAINYGCQDVEMMMKVMLEELPWPGDDVVWGWLPGAIPPSK